MDPKRLHLVLTFFILLLSNNANTRNSKENWMKYKHIAQSGFSKEKIAVAKAYYDSFSSSAFLIIKSEKVSINEMNVDLIIKDY